MASLLGLLTVDKILLGASVFFTYGIATVIYRLYLSPIAGFPGPKLAAVTTLYEIYHDVFPKGGQYTFKIGELHEKYGPIIRINPWELHIATPEFYDTLYSSTKKVEKWDYTIRAFGTTGGGFSTVDHNLHKMRRAPLAPYFSTANVKRLGPVVEERVQKFMQRLRSLAETGEVVRAAVMTSAFSTDVIMMYCFGRSWNRLEADDFCANDYDQNHEFFQTAWVMKHNFWIIRIVRSLPNFVIARLGGPIGTFYKLNQEFRQQVVETIAQKDAEHKNIAHRTIFHELLDSSLPIEEKAAPRLADEAQTIVGAASETIAWTITVIFYHLLANPTILRKLKEEFQEALKDQQDTGTEVVLERLPYLAAVIKEGLRLSYGVSSRLARVWTEPLIFNSGDREWIIPSGTPVGMSTPLIHHNEAIFPQSHDFQPERWVENPRLDRFLLSFSKGTRACMGMNLAWAELRILIWSVFTRFGSNGVRFDSDEGVLELVDTDISDVALVADFLVPEVKRGSKGVRFRVLK